MSTAAKTAIIASLAALIGVTVGASVTFQLIGSYAGDMWIGQLKSNHMEGIHFKVSVLRQLRKGDTAAALAILENGLAWIIHEGLGMMASRVPSQLGLDWRSR